MKWFLLIAIVFTHLTSNAQESWQSGFVDHNGGAHYYKTKGTGEPLIILHGGPGMFHDYLFPYLEPLTQNHQVVFYDQRGNGLSSSELTKTNFTIDILVDDLEALRAHFNFKKVNLLGHSWGGLLAGYYAKKHPTRISSLILTTPAGFSHDWNNESVKTKTQRFSNEQIQYIQSLLATGKVQQGDVKAFKELLTTVESVNFFDSSKANQFFDAMPYTTTKAMNALLIDGLKNQNQFFTNYNLLKDFFSMKFPVLVIHGSSDFIPLASSQATAAAFTNAKTVVFHKSGHYPFYEQPAKFIEVVDSFLN